MTFREQMIESGVKPLKDEDDYYQWRSCRIKRQYGSFKQANKVIKRMKNSEDLEAYRCKTCTSIHIGHKIELKNKGLLK